MYTGVEIDVLSLGDADCSVVTKWHQGTPHRVLIDGGCGQDAEGIIDFLRSRGYTNFWAAVCTHKHNDHASGLIKIVESPHIQIQNGWMHDMRSHFSAEVLRRASASDEALDTALTTTRALADAFQKRLVPIYEPFAGQRIANAPDMVVLGPTAAFYEKALTEFADIEPLSASANSLSHWATLLGGNDSTYGTLAGFSSNNQAYGLGQSALSVPISPLLGLLANSSVKTAPKTQPFNSTSVILGIRHENCKMLLTADAGSEALAFVPADWNCLTYLGVPHHGSEGNLSQTDIERLHPSYAYISAKGDGTHPSRKIVNGLVKVGAKVASTHRSGNLYFSCGSVPARPDYVPLDLLKGDVDPHPEAL